MARADPNSMRALHYAPVGSLVLLAACLEMEQTITIGKDGSGTQDVVLTVPAGTMAELRRAAAANQGEERADPGALFDEASVGKELAATGLELASHETSSDGNDRTVRLSVRFDDTGELRRSPLVGSSAEWEFAEGPVPGTIELSLYPQGKEAWALARKKAAEMREKPDPVAMDFFEKRCRQLAGLDLTFRFRLPGKVLRYTRNMRKTAEGEVTAHVTAAQIRTPQDLVRRLAPRFQVVFASAGCAIELDR